MFDFSGLLDIRLALVTTVLLRRGVIDFFLEKTCSQFGKGGEQAVFTSNDGFWISEKLKICL